MQNDSLRVLALNAEAARRCIPDSDVQLPNLHLDGMFTTLVPSKAHRVAILLNAEVDTARFNGRAPQFNDEAGLQAQLDKGVLSLDTVNTLENMLMTQVLEPLGITNGLPEALQLQEEGKLAALVAKMRPDGTLH